MMLYEPWMKYVISDDENGWCGIQEDAPQWAKDAWIAYQTWKENLYDNGIAIKV